MSEKFAAFFKTVGDILAWLIMALFAWLALTVNSLDKEIAAMRAEDAMHFATLDDKTKEIVPRSENERRYEALEKNAQQNFDRIGRLEQSCYQLMTDIDKKASR